MHECPEEIRSSPLLSLSSFCERFKKIPNERRINTAILSFFFKESLILLLFTSCCWRMGVHVCMRGRLGLHPIAQGNTRGAMQACIYIVIYGNASRRSSREHTCRHLLLRRRRRKRPLMRCNALHCSVARYHPTPFDTELRNHQQLVP